MKKIGLFVIALAMFASNNASAQMLAEAPMQNRMTRQAPTGGAIKGSIVDFESGQPLGTENFPYVRLELHKNVDGMLNFVAGSDCWSDVQMACVGQSGDFLILKGFDGKTLVGDYVLKVMSPFYMMKTLDVSVGSRDVHLDIQLRRMPAGFYITKVETVDGRMMVQGRAFRNGIEECENREHYNPQCATPELVARLSYNGPGVTTAYVSYDIERRQIVWESDYQSTLMTFYIQVNSKISDGSYFSGSIALHRASSAEHQYAQVWVSGTKGLPDYIGW